MTTSRRHETTEELQTRSLQLELAIAGVAAISRNSQVPEAQLFALERLSQDVTDLARTLYQGR